jgi:site-specific recombinase XerC
MATTMATLAEQFLEHGRYLRGWSPKTTRTYTQAFTLFPFDSVDDLSKASLQQFVVRLQQRGLSPGGINVRLRSLNSFLTWLHEDGHAAERFRLRLLRAPVRSVTPLRNPTDHWVQAARDADAPSPRARDGVARYGTADRGSSHAAANAGRS